MKDFARSGLVLKEYRSKTGKTQREISKQYGLHSQFWSNAERSICLLPTPVMAKLIKQKDFPKDIFKYALKLDLIESHWRKYEPVKRRKLKGRKSLGEI